MVRKLSKRARSDFNAYRFFFQKLVCYWTYGIYLKIAYKIELAGNTDFEKDADFIVASNHISLKDPFILVHTLKIPIAYMAKEELFENFFTRLILDWGGAFAVNRKKLDLSTIKTALSIKDTKWKLGLFPQGTRSGEGETDNISKGFASLAKSAKSDILPVVIINKNCDTARIFRRPITVNICELIPYSDNIDEMVDKWIQSVNELSASPNIS